MGYHPRKGGANHVIHRHRGWPPFAGGADGAKRQEQRPAHSGGFHFIRRDLRHRKLSPLAGRGRGH